MYHRPTSSILALLLNLAKHVKRVDHETSRISGKPNHQSLTKLPLYVTLHQSISYLTVHWPNSYIWVPDTDLDLKAARALSNFSFVLLPLVGFGRLALLPPLLLTRSEAQRTSQPIHGCPSDPKRLPVRSNMAAHQIQCVCPSDRIWLSVETDMTC